MQISLLKMKVTVLLLLVCVLQSVAGAYSQTTKYDISMTSGKLENVFKLIEQKGEYTFLYSIEDIDQISSVNVNVKQADLKEVLDICLANTKLTYEISGHLVIIRAKDEKPEDKMVVIKGVVKDKKGEPLPGVTIVEKGTKVGVATGVDGKFTFTVAKHDGIILVFSFVGMKTREITWTGQKELNVIMEEESQDMDEVVVTGYMNVNRRDMVGSYTTLKADDVMMPAYSSIDQMLQGQVPGMIVMNTSTRVGTSPKIQIRGTSTLLGNQDPLWVVDGIIQEDPLEIDANSAMITDLETILGNQISWLNPQDIETITVLKDASATAIYGSKASNGVIVVTTKKGKADRLSINYSGNFSVGTRPNYGQFNLMNSKERIQLSEEAFNDGVFYLEEPYKQPYTYEGAMRMYLAGEISQDEFLDRKEQLEKVNMATELNFSDNSYITTDTYYTEIDTKDMMGDAGDMGDVSAVVNSVDMSKIAFEVSVTLPNNIVKTNGTISETDKKVVKFNVPLGKKSVLFATTKGNVTLGDVQKKVKAANTIAKPKLKKIKANKLKKKAKSASVTVKWNKVKGAKKYEVTLSTDKKFIKNVKFKTTKKNTITIKKLKKNKKYFVQVVAVKKNLVGVDVYSKPAKKSVKTKK